MIALLYLLCGFGEVYLNEFMEMGMGARALGLGNAFVGLVDDATAVYWNPAGLSKIKKNELFLMHSDDFSGQIKLNSGALGFPLKSCVLGIGAYLLEAPDIPLTDTTQDTGSTYPGEVIAIDSINATDYVFYASYAHPFKSLDIGVNLKYIYRNWVLATAKGISMDLGIKSQFNGISYGINVVNLFSTPLSWSDTFDIEDKIPLLVKYGISVNHSFSKSQIAFCLGFDTSPEKRVCEFPELHTDTYLGLEYWWKNQLALRVGEDRGILTLGCGLAYQSLKLDYAFKFHPDIGLVKRLSGSIYF